MRSKLWLILGFMLVVLPWYTLTTVAAVQEYEYIGFENFNFQNLEYYLAHPSNRFSTMGYSRPFYAHTNDSVMIFTDGAWLYGDGVSVDDRNDHQALNSTLYLMTTEDFDRFWRNQSHNKSIIIYEPRDFSTYSITVPTDDLYMVMALSNYLGGSQYQYYGGTDAFIYLIPNDDGGNNITTINYNTENVNNTNNAYTTVHERAVVTWADAGLIAMICTTVIGVVLLRRRR